MSNDTFLLQDACDHCNLIFEDLSLYSDHDIISLAKGEDLEDSPPWSKLQNIWTNQKQGSVQWTNQRQKVCPVHQSETGDQSSGPIRNRDQSYGPIRHRTIVMWTNQKQKDSPMDQSETGDQSLGPIRNRRSVLWTNQKHEIWPLVQWTYQ